MNQPLVIAIFGTYHVIRNTNYVQLREHEKTIEVGYENGATYNYRNVDKLTFQKLKRKLDNLA